MVHISALVNNKNWKWQMEGKQKHSPMLILKGQWSFLYECAPLICDKSIIENSRIATARFRPILYLRGKAIVETLEMYISCRYFSYFVSSSWKKLLESLIFKRQSTRCSLRIIKISEARVTLIDEIFFEVFNAFWALDSFSSAIVQRKQMDANNDNEPALKAQSVTNFPKFVTCTACKIQYELDSDDFTIGWLEYGY